MIRDIERFVVALDALNWGVTYGEQGALANQPEVLHRRLQDQLRRVGEQHQADLALGLGRAPLPCAPARKCPNADRDWAWQWVFPASSHYLNCRTGPPASPPPGRIGHAEGGPAGGLADGSG